MLKIDKTGVSTSKRVYFRMFLPSLASVMAARPYFCSFLLLLSKYLPISWKQRKEQSHAQCHVTHRIRIFDKISEHVKVAKSVDIAVPELAVTINQCYIRNYEKRKRIGIKDVEYRCNVNQDFAPHFNSLFYKNKVIEVLSTWP